MKALARCVLEAIRARVRDRRLVVGVLCRSSLPLVEAIAAEGHRAIVVSDRFCTLLALQRRLALAAGGPTLLVEAPFDALPLAPASLDALVLAHGLPRQVRPPDDGDPADAGDPPQVARLRRLKTLLRPGGLLVWPHPVSEGRAGRVGRVLVPVRPAITRASRRHELTAWTMRAGFGEVGQRLARRRLTPWAVTTGSAGPRAGKPGRAGAAIAPGSAPRDPDR